MYCSESDLLQYISLCNYLHTVYTVELQFLKPPREMKIGSRNREVQNSEGKITVKQVQGKQLLVQNIGVLRNQGFEKSGFRCTCKQLINLISEFPLTIHFCVLLQHLLFMFFFNLIAKKICHDINLGMAAIQVLNNSIFGSTFGFRSPLQNEIIGHQ